MNLTQDLQAAEQAQRAGNLEDARNKYEHIVSYSSNTDALYGLATIYLQTKQLSAAIPLFEKALVQEPTAADIAYNYILCLQQNGNKQAALKVIDNMLKHALSNTEIALAYAFIAFNLEGYHQCIAILEALNNSSPKTSQILANAYMKTEQWQLAFNIWQKLAPQFPKEEVLHKNIALCATKVMKFDVAIKAYEKVITLEPSGRNYVSFADLYLIAHDSANARMMISKAIDMGEISLGRFETESKICRFENNKDGTLAAAKEALKIKPRSDFAWQAIQEFGTSGDIADCIKALAEYTKEDDTSSYELQQNLFTYAKALEKTCDFSLAFKQFTKAKSLQYQRFCDNGNRYNSEEIEAQYQRIKSIGYQALCEPHETNNIFIVGMPRSGTTLINRLLSQPSSNESCNESNGIATCFESLLLDSKQGPTEIASFLQQNGEMLSKNYREFVGLDADTLIDKMPHNFRYVGAILSTIPGARIVQMRRDPQDLALSIYSHQFHEYHNYACQLDTIAHAIAQANKLMDFWRQSFPGQVIDIDYQAFVRNPVKLGRELFDFCGQEWDDAYLDFYQQAVPSFTFSEIQVRKPINTSKIGFSKNYEKEFEAFRQRYEQYYPEGK